MSGRVFFRMATNAALTTISNTRTTAQAAIVLPDFGLPAIMTAGEMLLWFFSFSSFPPRVCNQARKID
jgi:hypothetical protein